MGYLKNTYLVISILSIYIFAWSIHSSIILNWDVYWDLLCSIRFLNGGTYTHNFFDLNPPLIFCHLMPVIFLTKFFKMTLAQSLNFYLLILSFFLLMICLFLLKKLFNTKDKFLIYLGITIIALIYTILPVYEFGQREHFLVMLSLPYFLLATYRAEEHSIKWIYAFGIGIIAASGFFLKPYFLFAPLFVELYLMGLKRRFWIWFRPETLGILIFFLLYIIFVAWFYPDYISIVSPMTLRYYHQGFNQPWFTLLFHILIIFVYTILVLFAWQYKNNVHRILASILALAILGFLFSYYAQRTTWIYHSYPAYSFSILLGLLLLSSILVRPHRYSAFLCVVTSLITLYPIYHAMCLYAYIQRYTNEHKILISFLQQNAKQQPVYLLSASGHNLLPATYYANTYYVSRYMHLFWVPSFAKSRKSNSSSLSSQQLADEKFLIQGIVDDLNNNKPKYVFVDVEKYKSFLTVNDFDYIHYLSEQPSFLTAWKDYHYVTTLESLYFKYDVYKREGTMHASFNRSPLLQ